MPIGPLVNMSATLLGGLIGASIGKHIPSYLREKMPQIFGLIAFCLGVPMVVGMTHMLSVVVAVLLGVIIGELLKLEQGIEVLASKIQKPLERRMKSSPAMSGDDFMTQYIAVLVLFSASGLGVIGSMTEGMTGQYDILLVKALLDFFTAIIFGTSLGYMVSLAAIPQGIVMLTLFFLGSTIMPLTTPDMLVNFSAVGGIIMVATGFQIMKIKEFSMANMLPALIIVMPLYALMN